MRDIEREGNREREYERYRARRKQRESVRDIEREGNRERQSVCEI